MELKFPNHVWTFFALPCAENLFKWNLIWEYENISDTRWWHGMWEWVQVDNGLVLSTPSSDVNSVENLTIHKYEAVRTDSVCILLLFTGELPKKSKPQKLFTK